MKGLGALIVVGLLIGIGFFIYFIFKILQFVVQAINLYKDMITRQDMMVRLLKDIRKTGGSTDQSISVRETTVCPDCGKRYEGDLTDQYCEECGAKLTRVTNHH